MLSDPNEIQSIFEIQQAIVYILNENGKMLCIGVFMENGDVLTHKEALGSVDRPIIKFPGINQLHYTFIRGHQDFARLKVSRVKVSLYSKVRKNQFLFSFFFCSGGRENAFTHAMWDSDEAVPAKVKTPLLSRQPMTPEPRYLFNLGSCPITRGSISPGTN